MVMCFKESWNLLRGLHAQSSCKLDGCARCHGRSRSDGCSTPYATHIMDTSRVLLSLLPKLYWYCCSTQELSLQWSAETVWRLGAADYADENYQHNSQQNTWEHWEVHRVQPTVGFWVALSLEVPVVGPLVVVREGASTVAVAQMRCAARRSLLVCLACKPLPCSDNMAQGISALHTHMHAYRNVLQRMFMI